MSDIIWSINKDNIKEELENLAVYRKASEYDQEKMLDFVADRIWHDFEETLTQATLAYAEIYAEDNDYYTDQDIKHTQDVQNMKDGWPV